MQTDRRQTAGMQKRSSTPATVIVVNDNHSQLVVLCTMLQKTGLDARGFATASEALRAMDSAKPPALIITDLCMQGLDGWQFCRLLRSVEYADFNQVPILVVSATPQEALQREWDEHDLTQYITTICGQERGTKKQSLKAAAKYAPNRTLMIGDAPGDHQAATANGALFFPINPGQEEGSWKRFFEEGIDRFLAGTFAGAYQDELLAEFDRHLPSEPPWPVDD